MTVDEILAQEELAPLMAQWLLEHTENWSEAVLAFDDLFYFYGRIFGGGLNHAVGAAPDGAISECVRLIRRYGPQELVEWVARFEAYFPDGVLDGPASLREAWESEYIEGAPDAAFDDLEAVLYRLEKELGNAICQSVRENVEAFRRCEAG